MKEEFLHWLWKNRLFHEDTMEDRYSGRVRLLSTGDYNRDSGPDFFNTRIIADGTILAGTCEIHINSSDWYRHGHHKDPGYDNVVIHVVHNNDGEVYTSSGRRVLTAVISFDDTYWRNYLELVTDPSPLPCSGHLRIEDIIASGNWIYRVGLGRLERKGSEVRLRLKETGNDWEETSYRMISRYFGFRVNSEPFDILTRRLPLRIIRKHSDNPVQVEALLYGTAGMLDESLFPEAVGDEYYRVLIREFRVLKAKYSIQPMNGWVWKFHRLRPVNFPTIRISQLASLLTGHDSLFSRILASVDTDSLRSLFSTSASGYWQMHFTFGKRALVSGRHTGRQATDLLIINAVVPLLYAYGRVRDMPAMCDRAVSILEALPPETNNLLDDFSAAGIVADSAFTGQALLDLRTTLCRNHRCLECGIGSSLVSMGHAPGMSDSLFLDSGITSFD